MFRKQRSQRGEERLRFRHAKRCKYSLRACGDGDRLSQEILNTI